MAADIIIHNGALMTFDEARGDALAIEGGKIVAVGGAEVMELAGPDTRVIDARGGTVLPGFIDSHVHLFTGSAELDYLNLQDVTGEDALTKAVRAYSSERPDDRLLFAACIDYNVLGDQTPTRQDLDRVMPDRPFAAMAADHHTVFANTAALDMAGLLHGADMPEGTEVVMAADGTAHGELREFGAYGPVMALTPLGGRDLEGLVTGRDPSPPATAAERAIDKDVIAKGLKHCASHGITGLHLMDGNFYQGELLSELEEDGRLLCRCEGRLTCLRSHRAPRQLPSRPKVHWIYCLPWLLTCCCV